MKHLDEGTIHAWLDGELSAADADTTLAHVNSCAECSAKVAEARGFIAGASRILTSLDGVPAVSPKRAPSTAPAVRQWRAAPWVTGIAATLMLAIGIQTYTRQEEPAKLVDRAAVLDSMKAVATTAAPSSATPTVPVANTPPRRDAALAEQARRAQATPTQRLQLRSAIGAGASQDLASGAGVAAPAPVAPTAAPAAVAAFKEASSPDAVAVLASTRDAAGCYPITALAAPRQVADAAVPTAAKAASGAAARRQAAPSTAPATAALSRATEEAVLPPLPSTVLLDTTQSPRGLLVRSPATRTPLGFWERLGTDSVRVNLLTHGVHTLSTDKRANCP